MVAERDRAQRHGDAARLDVGAPRRASGHDEGQRFVELPLRREDAGGHLDQRLALELVVEPHAVERGERVGAREGRDAVDVEADETVRCARCAAPRRGRGRQIGEVARRDHSEQVVGAVVERDLLPRRRAGLAEVGVAGQHADRQRSARRCAARTIGTARTRVGVSSNQSGRGRVDDAPALERLAHLGAPLRPHAVADDVAVEQRRRTARAGVRDGDERVVFGRHPDHDVGERQVGEKLTVAGETVEPLHVGFARPTLGVDEIAEGRHPSSLERARHAYAASRRSSDAPAARRDDATATDAAARRRPRARRLRRRTGAARA